MRQTFIVAAAVAFMSAANAHEEGGLTRWLPQAQRAESVEAMRPSVGVMGGYTNTANRRGQTAAWAVEGGYRPILPYEMALSLGGYSNPATVSQTPKTRTLLLGKVNYNIGGDTPIVKHSYVGLGIGPVWDNEANTIDVEFGVVPQIGLDLPVADHFTLGANANYQIVGGAKPNVFALSGVAKYWF